MDERIDLLRSVSDGRYVYIRNYMPHRIYGQHLWYMFETPTTRVWHAKHLAGELNEEQSHFWERKPSEELYDLRSDPDEVHNLIGQPGRYRKQEELRDALRAWELEVHDLGFRPEAQMHARVGEGAPYEFGRVHWDLRGAFAVIDWALSDRHPFMNFATSQQRVASALSGNPNPAVRYWAAVAFLAHEEAGVAKARAELHQALQDESPSVRIVAAEALGRFGSDEDLADALPVLLELADIERNGVYVAVAALNALDELDERAASVKDQIVALPRKAEGVPQRLGDYAERLIQKTLSDLNQPNP